MVSPTTCRNWRSSRGSSRRSRLESMGGSRTTTRLPRMPARSASLPPAAPVRAAQSAQSGRSSTWIVLQLSNLLQAAETGGLRFFRWRQKETSPGTPSFSHPNSFAFYVLDVGTRVPAPGQTQVPGECDFHSTVLARPLCYFLPGASYIEKRPLRNE